MGELQESTETLVRYISVLLDTFPTPITRAELAQKSGVSKAAITKQNERLYEFSDKDKFAFRGLVLNESGDIPNKIAWIFITNKRFSQFVKSRYFRAILQNMKAHERIREAYPTYGDYFKPSDTAFMLQTLLVKSMVLDTFRMLQQKAADDEERALLVSMSFVRLIPKALESIDLDVGTEEKLKRWLDLRDKWYFFIEHLVLELVHSLEILKEVDNPEAYVLVYGNTVKFYLGKAFEGVSSYFEERAKLSGLIFKPQYKKIGAFFNPRATSVIRKG